MATNKSRRAKPSGVSLTRHDASQAKGMLARGDRVHDIAAWFGVNPGRIADVKSGRLHPNAPVARKNLPPAGPYLSGRDTHALILSLKQARVVLQNADADIAASLGKLEKTT